ncbi:MAG: prenyltransferase [Eggerthellaceae bacterium]|nr:prenyltransferase [Eggerthellaceae bacterium]
MNPHSALGLAIGFLAVAFILGIYVVVCTGWIPLVIAVIGALAIFFYSGGKTPISYLPIGELVSGCVMGGLIPLACFYVLTGTFSWFALIWAIPTIIGVGLIMMTNNISDIEKDEEANRHTLPVVLGRSRTRTLYHALIWIWLLADIVNVIIWFTNGIIFCIFLLVASYPLLKAMFSNPLTPQMRITSISQICTLNIALGAFYCLSMVAGDAIRFLLI